MSKKIFAISTLLLVLVVAFAFVYNFVFKKPSAGQNGKSSTNVAKTTSSDEGKAAGNINTNSNSSSQSSNQSSDGQSANDASNENSIVVSVSDGPVFGATVSSDGKFLHYFLAGNGQLNQATFDGKLGKVLSTEKYEGIKKITWNRQKNRAVIKTRTSAGKTKFLVYGLASKKVSVLKENTDSVAWSSLGDKLIYKYFDSKTKKRTISVSDPDGANWKGLAEFDFSNVEIAAIPNSSDISFWPSPDANLSTVVGTIPFSGGNRQEIFHGRFGADFLWAPNGEMAAASYTDQKDGHKTDLAVMNKNGDGFQPLGFPTFVSKCVWSDDSKIIFCALPGDIPESAVLPDDWQSGKARTADTFWKIEVSSGKKERLVNTEKIPQSFDAINLFLSEDEKTLFFVNKADGKLYKLKM